MNWIKKILLYLLKYIENREKRKVYSQDVYLDVRVMRGGSVITQIIISPLAHMRYDFPYPIATSPGTGKLLVGFDFIPCVNTVRLRPGEIIELEND